MTTSISQNSMPTYPPLPSRSLLWFIRTLCMIALSISGYLAWTAFTAQPVAGCGSGEIFDCSHVLTSEYSKVLGIPVSVPAFSMYASLLAVLAFMKPGAPQSVLRNGWGIFTIGAFSAGLAAIWFTGVQVFMLEHLCPWCLGAHACGVILAGIVLWKRPLGLANTAKLSSISVAGVAGLIATQVMVTPPDNFVVERFDDDADSSVRVASADFAAPTEFGAPEFAPPVEFAPPTTAAEEDVFAPPVFSAPAVADNVFAPPAVSDDTAPSPSETPVENSTTESSATKTSDATDADITTTNKADASLPDGTPRALAASALLFISPSTASLLTKFFADTPTMSGVKNRTVKKPAQRLVSVAGKKFSLNTRDWPLLGNPDAKYIFVEMFDYTCPHCRHTHHAIDGAFKTLGSDLAVIALSVPIDPACNDAIRSSGHAGACELAKLSVAVWRCDRNKFKAYHDWMFQRHRSYSDARRKADALVGKDTMTAELALPYAKSYVARHVELYKRVGSGVVPKLMFPRSTITGQVSSASRLVSTIQRELGR